MSNSTRKTVAWSVLAFIVALWIFVVFFFDGILSRLAEERLESVVASATHGEYQLAFTTFQIHRGTLTATGMDMRRIAYRASEHGTTVRDLGINSVRVTGISWWEVLFGKPITLSILRTYEPRVYLADFSQDRAEWKLLPPYVPPAPSPLKNVLISFDSVFIPGLWSYGQVGDYPHSTDKPDGVLSFSCQKLAYDSKSNAPLELTYQDFQLHVPWIEYHDSSAIYSVRKLDATSQDSLLSADRFLFVNGSTRVSGTGVWASGIGIVRLVAGNGVSAERFQAQSWGLALSAGASGKSKPQPAGLPWQDKLARSANFPIRIDTLLLGSGALDLHFKPASSFTAHALNLRAYQVDFDTGAVSDRPGYARTFDVAAGEARFASNAMDIAAKDFRGRIEDSDISTGAIAYGSGTKAIKLLRVGRSSATRVGFRELLAGTGIEAYAVRASGWTISKLPTSSKTSKASAHTTIWTTQQNIAKSVAIPVHIALIDLTNGRVHVTGATSPTIIANGTAVRAVGFTLDPRTAASKKLLFSNDVTVATRQFHFADRSQHDIVNLSHARTRLGSRSIYAARASYTTRSAFEPNLNNTTYATKNLDLSDIDFAGLLDSRRIALGGMRVSSWKIERSADTITEPPAVAEGLTAPAPKKKVPGWTEFIRIGKATLPNGSVLFKERDTTPSGFSPIVQSYVKSLDITRFRFLPPKGKRPRLKFDQVLFAIPSFTYAPLDGFYEAEVLNMNGNFKDSIVQMDSVNYEPKYGEDEFARLHKYARGRSDFRMAGVKVLGVDARRMINGGGVVIDSFDAPTLWMDYYKDNTVPADPHPSPAVMPNQLVRSLNIPFTVDYISIDKGHIQLREKTKAGVPTGDFTFDSVSLGAGPLTFDTASRLVDTPTNFLLTGYLLGKAPATVALVYPLHDSALNLAVKAGVGPFDLTALNQYLVNANRIEVKSGNFYKADVTMDVKDNMATTFVEPIYNHFKIKILDTEPGSPGLGHRLETFAANTFVLRDDNPDEDGGPPVTATTTLTRDTSEEFFQFLWFSIRKSLGTVVGGFK